jgi:ABC-2 type transport system permease protein
MTDATDAQLLRRAARRKGRSGDRGAQRPAQQRQKVQYTQLDPEVRAPRHGWMIVARKEFADLLLSPLFLILVFVMAVAAGSAVYSTAGQLRSVDIAAQASGARSLFLVLFAPPSVVAAQGQPSFIFWFSFLGPLVGIALGFAGINSERAEGTLPRLLSQPIHRDDVINGKFVAGLSVVAVAFAAVMLIIAAVGILQLGVVPDPESVLRLMIWWVLAVLYVGFWLAFALLCSVVIRRAAFSAITALGTWLILTLLASFIVSILASVLAPAGANASTEQQIANVTMTQNLSRLSPTQLFTDVTQVILDPSRRTLSVVAQVLQLNDPSTGAIPSLLSLDQSVLVIWPQVVALVAFTVIAFAAAYIGFMRQEVRA